MRRYRTVLEQKIRERKQTFEEFAEYVETFAREHNEPGTLSVRHLQRLVSGRRSDGRKLGPVHPATARLLERIFDLPIDELLSPPSSSTLSGDSETELRQRLYASSQVDDTMVTMLQDQLDSIRHLDRQLGATVAHDEAVTKAAQVSALLAYAMSPRIRRRLASLLSELYCLAGWQALDLGQASESWQYYDLANSAGLESESYAFKALAEAGRAFVLIDIGETSAAVDAANAARQKAETTCSNTIRSWLAAAHGETLAADHRPVESFRAFDNADNLLSDHTTATPEPYVALDPIHLGRWRGHALSRCGETTAISTLTESLRHLDPSFTRAQTALRVDLANALLIAGEPEEAGSQARKATELANKIGSIRQQQRIIGLLNSQTSKHQP